MSTLFMCSKKEMLAQKIGFNSSVNGVTRIFTPRRKALIKIIFIFYTWETFPCSCTKLFYVVSHEFNAIYIFAFIKKVKILNVRNYAIKNGQRGTLYLCHSNFIRKFQIFNIFHCQMQCNLCSYVKSEFS